MPPRQKQGGRQPTTRSTRGTSSKSATQNVVPDIYKEMLAEAVPSLAKSDEDGKTVKKRRVGGRIVTYGGEEGKEKVVTKDELDNAESDRGAAGRVQQTVYDESAESSEDDMEWEEVELKQVADGSLLQNGTDSKDELSLEIRLDRGTGLDKTPKIQRRKPVTGAEKKMRLDVHKTHLLCLLAHVSIRNHWCNDIDLQEDLRSLLSARTKSYLNPAEDQSQFQQSRSFMDGLEQVSNLWQKAFKITARGMRRGYWADDDIDLNKISDDFENISDKTDFLFQAKLRTGSQDFGAQLLCALLRSVAVEARLVCSLQPLSFLGVAKGMTPQKPKPVMINASDLESHENTTDETSGAETQSKPPIPPPRIRRLGRPEFTEPKPEATISRPSPQNRPKRIKESPYPIFWVEALNESSQKWVPFDPIVTQTISKPSKIEPPSNDPENNLSYVIAFEEDGSAVDVTRRYAKSFNAKTRKNRVESTKDGERWWRRTMNYYKKSFQEDRDQLEAGELAAKEAAEPMPRNVQDFKDHPLYALERHLRRNEVLHPRREVGKASAGKISLNKTDVASEPVFRRRDVHVVRSAESWYRLGREIKSGEQPLKRAAPRRNKEVIEDEDGMEEEDLSVGLYAAFQTEIYKAPPVVDGKIPKNVYGNLDVYMPSMVPTGGFHLQHPQGARAAKLLGIDYAEAVTGFEFKGRQGHAVFRGVVVAVEYREALFEILQGFEDEEAQAQEDRRSLRALHMWKRLLLRLRIREKVEEHGGEIDQEERLAEDVDDDDDGGGFFPDRNEAMAEPSAGEFGKSRITDGFEDEGGGFMADELNEEIQHTSPVVPVVGKTTSQSGAALGSRPTPSPRKGNRTRYILQVRSLDDPDPYANRPIPPTSSRPMPVQNPVVHGEVPDSGDVGVLPRAAVLDDPQRNSSEPGFELNEMEIDAERAPSSQGEPTQGDLRDRRRMIESSESELEKASLLSFDPEDEDADPEWVDSF